MIVDICFHIWQVQSLAISTMERLTIEQRVKVIEAYYENGRSNKNAFRALRDFFGQHNRPTESAIGKIVKKFKQTGSVADVKAPLRARVRRSAENIAAVRENVAENPGTSIRHRAQELNLSATTLHRILRKDLSLHAYKIQLTQELKHADHLKRRTFADWMHEQRQINEDFSQKIIFSDEAKPISILAASLISRIVGFGLMKIQGRLLKSRCIHKRSLFGVHFLLAESLDRFFFK